MISFIIPVYNCEKYLDKCISSIINTKIDKEIILVDDGSTDNSGSICNKYSDKFNYIQAYHIPNGGPSGARNMGIMKSKGDYICFVDSDDFVNGEVYDEIDRVIEEYSVDLIISQMNLYDDNKQVWAGITDAGLERKTISFENQEVVLKELIEQKITPSPCRYVIKSSIIKDNNILFKEHIQHEDTLWYPQLLCNCHSFYFIDHPFYNIIMRQGSRGKVTHEKRRKSLLMINNELIKYSKNRNSVQKEFIYQNININLNFLMLEYFRMSNCEKTEIKNWFINNDSLMSSIIANDRIKKYLSIILGYYRSYICYALLLNLKILVNDKVNLIKGQVLKNEDR